MVQCQPEVRIVNQHVVQLMMSMMMTTTRKLAQPSLSVVSSAILVAVSEFLSFLCLYDL
jgi:hypothetical protein